MVGRQVQGKRASHIYKCYDGKVEREEEGGRRNGLAGRLSDTSAFGETGERKEVDTRSYSVSWSGHQLNMRKRGTRTTADRHRSSFDCVCVAGYSLLANGIICSFSHSLSIRVHGYVCVSLPPFWRSFFASSIMQHSTTNKLPAQGECVETFRITGEVSSVSRWEWCVCVSL